MEEINLSYGGLGFAESNQGLTKSPQPKMLFDQLPIEPGRFVVLAIGVVIAVLSAATFVAG